MTIRQRAEKGILKIAEKMLQPTTFDRLLIERRRRINKVTGYYPEAVFFSKEKSEKKYCVVRYACPTFALMAAGIQYVFCYHQLVERGYIPLIDIEYAYSYKQGRLGENNLWDLCFKQPITVQEAVKQPYVLAAGQFFSYSDDPKICIDINDDENDHFIHVRKEDFREYYAKAKKYVDPIWQVKDEIIEELDAELWSKVKGHRVLGVFLREAFTKDVAHNSAEDKVVYNNHPLLPSVSETIEIIKTQLCEWKYDLIFLSTVYEDSLELFKKEFGDKVLYINRKRGNTFDKREVNFGTGEKELYEYHCLNQNLYNNRFKAYLKEIIALSRCDYLVGGGSSGMAAALVINGGKYDDIHIFKDARAIQRY